MIPLLLGILSRFYCYPGTKDPSECPENFTVIENLSRILFDANILLLDDGLSFDSTFKTPVAFFAPESYSIAFNIITPSSTLRASFYNVSIIIQTNQTVFNGQHMSFNNSQIIIPEGLQFNLESLDSDINSLNPNIISPDIRIFCLNEPKENMKIKSLSTLNLDFTSKINISCSYNEKYIQFEVGSHSLVFESSINQIQNADITCMDSNLIFNQNVSKGNTRIHLNIFRGSLLIPYYQSLSLSIYLDNSELAYVPSSTTNNIMLNVKGKCQLPNQLTVNSLYLSNTTISFISQEDAKIHTTLFSIVKMVTFDSASPIVFQTLSAFIESNTIITNLKDGTITIDSSVSTIQSSCEKLILKGGISIKTNFGEELKFNSIESEFDIQILCSITNPDDFNQYINNSVPIVTVSTGDIHIKKLAFGDSTVQSSDPWSLNTKIWDDSRLIYTKSFENHQFSITLLANPFTTYLRVYYTTNQTYQNDYGVRIITPDDMNWWKYTEPLTKGVTIYFSEANTQPLAFPSEASKLQNITIAPTIFDDRTEADFTVLIDPTNIENIVENFTVSSLYNLNKKLLSISKVKFVDGKTHKISVERFRVFSKNTEIEGELDLSNTKYAGGYWNSSFMKTIKTKDSLDVFIPENDLIIEHGETIQVHKQNEQPSQIGSSSQYRIFFDGITITDNLLNVQNPTKTVFIPNLQNSLDRRLILTGTYNGEMPIISLDDPDHRITVYSNSNFPLFYNSDIVSHTYVNNRSSTAVIYQFTAIETNLKSSYGGPITAHVTCNESIVQCKFSSNDIKTTYTITNKKGAMIKGTVDKINVIGGENIILSDVNNEVDVYLEYDDIDNVTMINTFSPVVINNLVLNFTRTNLKFDHSKVVIVGSFYVNNPRVICQECNEKNLEIKLEKEDNFLLLKFDYDDDKSNYLIYIIIGIVIPLVLIIVVGVVLFFYCRRQRIAKASQSMSAVLL